MPSRNYMFKVNNRNIRIKCEICSKSTIKTPKRRLFLFYTPRKHQKKFGKLRSGVFIVHSEHISHFVPVFLLLTLNRQVPAGRVIKRTNTFVTNIFLFIKFLFATLKIKLYLQKHDISKILSWSLNISRCLVFPTESLSSPTTMR